MKRVTTMLSATSLALALFWGSCAHAQEFRHRQDLMCAMLKAKLDTILPKVMRENHIDMWIIATREGAVDQNTAMFPPAYTPGYGYYVFTDRGGARLERIALRHLGEELDHCGAFDKTAVRQDIHGFVAERNPKSIAIDMASEIGAADGLSHTMYEKLVKDLGAPYASRLVSAEKLVSEYRSLQTPEEIDAYSKAGEFSRHIAEEAFSNAVITPGKTTLRQVSDWMADQLLLRGLGDSFDIPNVALQRQGGLKSGGDSDDTVIEPGDLLNVDWGVGYLNKWTDMKRTAYILKPGETRLPPGIQHAFDQAVAVREMLLKTIKPGGTGDDMLVKVNQVVGAMPGYKTLSLEDRAPVMPPPGDPLTTALIGCHSTGDLGHGSGASVISWPVRKSYVLQPTQALVIEFFTNTAVPEWGGQRVGMALEDDAILTGDGVRFVYPPISEILLVH
jgi:Xaa-Pro aminopeptidase